MQLSIIIPAYNEAGRITSMLEAYATAFPTAQILVVPNGCTDATASIASAIAGNFRNIEVLEIHEPVGKALAVRHGWLQARGYWLAFVDADGSTTAAEFQRLLDAASGADGAIASRWAPGARVENRTTLRKVASYVFAAFVKLLFWLPYRDTQCGAKVFSRTKLLPLLGRVRITNMAFDVELLLLLQRAGARIVEWPTHWVDHSDSAILGSPLKLLRNSVLMLWTLLTLRLRFSPFSTQRV